MLHFMRLFVPFSLEPVSWMRPWSGSENFKCYFNLVQFLRLVIISESFFIVYSISLDNCFQNVIFIIQLLRAMVQSLLI